MEVVRVLVVVVLVVVLVAVGALNDTLDAKLNE